MANYSKELRDMTWSYSSLTTYEHCKYEFYLNYIIRDDEQYLREGNYYAEVGSFVHEILAMYYEGKIDQDEALAYYVENFDDNVFYSVKKSTMDKTYDACRDYFMFADFSWLNKYEILGVEMETRFNIGGYKFVGYIDLLVRDKRDGRIVIIDNKSSPYPFKNDGGVKAASRDSFDKYKKQMYLYAYAVHDIFDEYPKELAWNHFKDGGKFATIPFDMAEYNKAVKWAFDTIQDAEKEEDFPDSQEYFYCKNLCNFRNSCEYVTGGS